MDTPAFAKLSAEAVAPMTGISKTKSAPHLRAISVRKYLSRNAGVPLCTKLPLIATIM